MNTYQLHSQLAYTVRTAALLRQELSAKRCSFFGRISRRIRHAYLMFSVETLRRQLRGRYQCR